MRAIPANIDEIVSEACLFTGLDLRPLPSKEIETDWRTWLRALYPDAFKYNFAPHHERFWEHSWNVDKIIRPRPFVYVLPRFGGKSTGVEVVGPMFGARRLRRYGWYISFTQEMANMHLSTVEQKLTAGTYREFYPEMASPKLNEIHHTKGWSHKRLWTNDDWAMDSLGLDTACRGGKIGNQRPDFMIFDDIVGKRESQIVVANNMSVIKHDILPSGAENLAVFVAQNLVYKDSIVAQIVDGRAGFLLDAIIEGPHPAVLDFEYEQKGREVVVLGGTFTWEGQNLQKVQEQINTYGLNAFKREMQHEVETREEGAVFPQFDERYSVITWSEFARVYGDIAWGTRDDRIVPRPPARWMKGLAQDFGTTTGHPCGTIWMMRPSAADPFSDTVYVYRELVIPEYPYPITKTEDISPGSISKMMYEAESVWQEKMSMQMFSHEQTAALNTYWRDLPAIYKRRFTKWRPDRRAGIAVMQNHFQLIDKERPNPFRPELMGRSRLVIIVADGQGELIFNGRRNAYEVAPAEDAAGMKRFRDELKEYHYPQNAVGMEAELPYKDFDDLIDPAKALADVFFPGKAPLTEAEKVDNLMPADLKSAVVASIEDPVQRQAAEFCAYTAQQGARRRLRESQPQQRKSLRGMKRESSIVPQFGRY